MLCFEIQQYLNIKCIDTFIESLQNAIVLFRNRLVPMSLFQNIHIISEVYANT